METLKHCAYNQTSDCILGSDVDAADFSDATLHERIPELVPQSGAGLWMVPFRGIPASGVRAPLDLLYLNENCQVIDQVESFPTFRVSASSPTASSVLALPAQSIAVSRTRLGDQLVVCLAREMERRIHRRNGSPGSFVPSTDSLQLGSLRSGDPGAERDSEERQVRSSQQSTPGSFDPWQKNTKPKSWLERWLSPAPVDPRRSPREPFPGLTAYFWTGGTPEAQIIRDVSANGLYVVTEERWYPGTQIRMTLTKKGCGGSEAERSIFVQAKAVRWGNDGVGLEFVLPDNRNLRRGAAPPVDGADKQDFEEFLQHLKQARDQGRS
jgi:hypothetical protein